MFCKIVEQMFYKIVEQMFCKIVEQMFCKIVEQMFCKIVEQMFHKVAGLGHRMGVCPEKNIFLRSSSKFYVYHYYIHRNILY